MKRLRWITFVLFSTLLWVACEEDNPINNPMYNLSISTPEYANLTDEGFSLSATISGDNTSTISKRGFCYDTQPGPTIFSKTVNASANGLNITSQLIGLSQETTYYVRAFVTLRDADPVYSSEIVVKTLKTVVNEREALDRYEAPTYVDNYTNIASWSNRSRWNLANVHDPTVEKCGDYYYMYQTNASYGNAHEGHGHFHYRRSKDLVNWEYCGASMPTTPVWVKDSLNNMRSRQGLAPIDSPSYGYWAPVVRKAGNKYRMYYSIIIDNYIQTGKQNTAANFDGSWTERAFIGLMETDDLGSNQWVDKGMVVCSSTDKGLNWSRPNTNNWEGYFRWNAIDPSFIITPENEHWLIYGSWHSGIAALQLNPETGLPLKALGEAWDNSAASTYGQRIFRRNNNRWQASEAPEIVYNPETGYYYLFMAYDELSVAYNTRVLRSTSITGPYTGDKVITHPYKFNNDIGWVGISHNAVFKDDEGNWFYASQGRFPNDVAGINASNAVMMGHVRKIRWTNDGWPVVMPERYGAVPDVTIEEWELIGDWENITLVYDIGQQRTSVKLTLNEDKTATGALTGRWSWDAEKKILTIGSRSLCVEREVDWEANPRKHTLVFSGLNTAGQSLWGKKL